MMCVFKINKLKPGRTSLTVEKDIYKKYQNAGGGTYDAATAENCGTYGTILAVVLNGFTGGNWKWRQTHPDDVPQKLIEKVGVTDRMGPTVSVNPVILGVDWDLGGAHWVVVDTIRSFGGSNYATICDPWDTNVHMQKFNTGAPFYYDAASGGFMVNLWGTNKGATQPYQGNSAKGQVKTWGMIYRDTV
jgi:hypothetical protein